MSRTGPLRVGLIGVNTTHADAFARILNGEGERPAALDGGRVVAIWGAQPERRDEVRAAHAIPRAVASPADMLGDIDLALVIDDAGKAETPGRSHPGLARIFLEAGVPTFVDKPMTERIEDAEALFALAAERGVPLMSSSSLRHARELDEVRERVAHLGGGPVTSATCVGPNGWYYYGIHAVEMLQALLGRGAAWVHRFVWPGRDVAVVGWEDGRSGVVEVMRDSRCGFSVTAWCAGGCERSLVTDSDAYYTRQAAAALEMAATGRSPIDAEDTLEVLAILHAGLASERRGDRVALREVRGAR